MLLTREEIHKLVDLEREHQTRKHGDQLDDPPSRRICYIMEEVMEAYQGAAPFELGFNGKHHEGECWRYELIQAAALCFKALEGLDTEDGLWFQSAEGERVGYGTRDVLARAKLYEALEAHGISTSDLPPIR